jgi:DNA helicase-2/ATP-dependent DNA helicase PcrA
MSKLNPLQSEAVFYTENPLLILAGAGSGKTRVLTHKIAHLIEEKGLSPYQILAVTFTNKAAFEMKTRVEDLLPGFRSNLTWITTFHSAGLKILRREAKDLGLNPDFSIYDDKDQQKVIQSSLEDLKINPKVLSPKSVSYTINQAKNQMISAQDFLSRDLDFLEEKIAEVYVDYEKKMQKNQAFDFGDLILKTTKYLEENSSLREKYQNQFQYILVDEYQDTNHAQYRMMKALVGEKQQVTVVGDDDQSIYKFRGAEIRNILDFQNDYPNAHLIKLEQNYRSTQNILDAAGAVVEKNQGRLGKKLWTDNDDGEKLTVFFGETERDEASFVTKEIKELINEYKYQEITLFYRTHAQSRVFEEEFNKRAIPYQIVGGLKFYDRQEIKDILAYLKVLVNPNDVVSLSRIINLPTRGIGKTSLLKLNDLANQTGKTWMEICGNFKYPNFDPELYAKTSMVLAGSIQKKLILFYTLVEKLNTKRAEISLVDFIQHLYQETGYLQMWQSQEGIEAESRIENLDEFINVIAEFEKNEENSSLEAFLDQASLTAGVDNMDSVNRVTMMTLHLAKGLEFPAVFMVGMEEGLFPHSRSLYSDEELEEERRLCYVGMTRAMKKLYLSCVKRRQLYKGNQFNLPSRFLDEIPDHLVDTIKSNYFEQKSTSEVTYDNEVRVDYSFDQSVSEDQSPYQKGRRVKHQTFGMGVIQSTENSSQGEKVTISFSNGQTKKLMVKYAGLEVF